MARRSKRYPSLKERVAERGASSGPDDELDLQTEIDLLRDLVHRVNQRAGTVDDVLELSKVMDRLGRASTRLADLLKAQQALKESAADTGDDGSLAQVLEEVIATARKGGPCG